MSLKQAILWDMDGVLVDTGELHYQSWSLTLAEQGIALTREAFRTTFGMNNAGILQLLLGNAVKPELIDDIGERKEELFRQAVKGQARLLPGVLGWLIRFKDGGIKQAIASSAPMANIDALVDELKVRHYFQAVVSGADLPGKPDPAVFLKAAGLLNVPAAKCLVIEDSVAGVEGARRAGMRCIAVTTTNPADALRTADVVVDRLDQLTDEAFRG